MNVPTMTLQLVAASDQLRVQFEKDGEDRIDGIDTWEIEFEEVGPPRRSIEVNCEATYSNFRRFEVQVNFNTGP